MQEHCWAGQLLQAQGGSWLAANTCTCMTFMTTMTWALAEADNASGPSGMHQLLVMLWVTGTVLKGVPNNLESYASWWRTHASWREIPPPSSWRPSTSHRGVMEVILPGRWPA